MSRNITTRAALVLAISALAVAARAQQPAGTPALDPAAVRALNAMSGYLRNLKSFQVESATTTDQVLDDGQLVQQTSTINFLVQMPNKLLAEQSSDRQDRTYVYDGKSFTLYARRIGYYATVPAPSTLRELDDVLNDKYDIELPLADLFRFGSPDWNANDIKGAMDLGPSAVGDTTCEHYAFRQDGIDWQIWIQKGEYPLPRKLVIATTDDPARPQHTETFTWNLAPSFNDAAFTFVAPSAAKKIVLADRRSELREINDDTHDPRLCFDCVGRPAVRLGGDSRGREE